MGEKLTHWHIQTKHQQGTPDYPSKEAVYIYRTACAKELLSVYQTEEYELTQNQGLLDTVNCRPCKVWATHYFKQNENISGDYIFKRTPTQKDTK